MTRSRPLRAVTALALTVPTAGALVLAGAPAASAAVTNPGDGATYGSETTIAVRADHGTSRTENQLTLTSPGGAPVVVARSAGSGFNGGTLSYALDLACWTFPSSQCSGRVPAPNGTWVITQTGGATDRTTFTTRVPPAAPGSVSAAGQSVREVVVSWNRNVEPDVTGYAVFEGDSAVKEGVSPASCEASRCSTTVTYAGDSPGEHTYVVRAYRSAGPGTGDTLASPASGPASATLAAPSPSPEPTADPAPGSTGQPVPGGSPAPGPGTGSPGASAGPGSSPAPGASGGASPGSTPSPGGSAVATPGSSPRPTSAAAAVAQRRAFASGFSAFGPKLGIPKLPPLPQSGLEPTIAEPLPDGTFAPTLGFEDQVLQERVEALTPGRRISDAVSSAFDSERLARSTAGALVLLLMGAHLRRWLGAASQD